MNFLHPVAEFISLTPLQIQNKIKENDFSLYLTTLEILNQEDGNWLKDNELVEKIVSRLWRINPKNSEELLKTISIFEKIKLKNYEFPPLKEIFQKFLEEMKNNSISISSIETDLINVKLKIDSQEQQWNFLNKLPVLSIKKISFEGPLDLKCLLNFLKLHPEINSLSLDSNISDDQLEEIFNNLPNIKDFEIKSGSITIIQATICNQLTALRCYDCPLLTTINTPKADMVACWNCKALTTITSPNATTLRCNNCPLLTTIDTPNARTIDYNYCPLLTAIHAPNAREFLCTNCPLFTTIDVPNARELFCSHCPLITSINAPNATMLNCSNCPVLAEITAPNARELFCSHCPLITSITAPNATVLDCSNCPVLAEITAPNTTMLFCENCALLTSITAPNATTLNCNNSPLLATIDTSNTIKLYCHNCPLLTEITAPNATTLDCSNCPLITIIDAPKALKLDCSNCPLITTIDAPKALELNCSNCPVITSINAPKALEIDCSNCQILSTINAPNATTLLCNYCETLTAINAPKALEIECSCCQALVIINAPNATSLYCIDCPSLTTIKITNATELFLNCSYSQARTNIIIPNVIRLTCNEYETIEDKVKVDLFKKVYRNIITNLGQMPDNFINLIQHAKPHLNNIKFNEVFLLNQWFADIFRFIETSEFSSVEDNQRIEDFLAELLSLMEYEVNFQDVNLEWFQTLKKLDCLQQKIKRIIWLGTIFASNNQKTNPLSDDAAIPTLKVIGKLTDVFLQREASRSLFLLYNENTSRYKIWKSLAHKYKKPHLILLVLFFSTLEIDKETIEILMKCLKPNHYKYFRTLNPILEMISLLFKNSSLQKEDQEKIVKLILKLEVPKMPHPDEEFKVYKKEELKKTRGQLKQNFKNQVTQFRKNQRKWVNACRDLLFFEQGEVLKSIETVEELLKIHQNFCREFFGVEKELAENFSDFFKTDRYLNPLFTYAARLQTLSEEQKAIITPMLGKFVNSCLNGEFPGNRYELSDNPHLKKIFENNPELLEKWKEPLEISLSQIKKLNETSQTPSHIIIRDLMKNAINNGHLGKDKSELSKEFTNALESDEFITIQDTISVSEIEMDCLRALDPSITSDKRIGMLTSLLKKFPNPLFPNSLEFKNDIKGMIEAVSSIETKQPNLKSIMSAETWDDFLLMGTEVNNSCQRIDGDPDLNKCLLAYILDGKNKVILVKDSQGIIVARTVLRILWDEAQKRPVLFMERIYTKGANEELFNLIRKGCKAIAKNMNLTLVASRKDFPDGPPYNGDLSALGGPVPFEYVDALSGIQKNGEFAISFSRIILSM